MKKSETRFINQCTHVQINPDLKSKRERVVYSDVLRKHGILTTVFDDRRIATQVLERLKTQEKYGDLCKAVGHLWDGDVAASSAIVGVAPVEDVKHFADDALAVERSLFEKAETEVGETIDSVMQSTVQKADIGEEIVTALRREMADMRRSIVEDVRGLVRQEAVEAMAARGPRDSDVFRRCSILRPADHTRLGGYCGHRLHSGIYGHLQRARRTETKTGEVAVRPDAGPSDRLSGARATQLHGARVRPRRACLFAADAAR